MDLALRIRQRRWLVAVVAGAVSIGLLGVNSFRRSRALAIFTFEQRELNAAKPSPIAKKVITYAESAPLPPAYRAAPSETTRARKAEAPRPAAGRDDGSRWAVVAAIYRSFAAAQQRAESIAGPALARPYVYPPDGQGNGKYMVVLAQGLTREQADRLQQQALASGLPSDTYVTRIGPDVATHKDELRDISPTPQ